MNKFLKFRLIKKRLQAAALKSEKSCVAGGVGGTAPDQREGRKCTSPRMPDPLFQTAAPAARPCPTVPAGGLDIGSETPVCEQPARKIAPQGSPPPRFQTFKAFCVWRPGLGIRSFASLSRHLSCTLSTSYTNLLCMSCKIATLGLHLSYLGQGVVRLLQPSHSVMRRQRNRC